MSNQKLGVVDIGTLKVKCQIVEVQENGDIKTLHNSNILTCLGLRLEENNGKPEQQHLQATLDELKHCQELFKTFNVDKQGLNKSML